MKQGRVFTELLCLLKALLPAHRSERQSRTHLPNHAVMDSRRKPRPQALGPGLHLPWPLTAPFQEVLEQRKQRAARLRSGQQLGTAGGRRASEQISEFGK